MENQNQTPDSGVVTEKVALPSYGTLVSESFTKGVSSWPMFLLLAGSSFVMGLASFLLESEMVEGIAIILAVVVVMFAAIFTNLAATVVAVKYYLNDGAIDILASLKEVFSNGWSYLWVLSLSTLVMFSGFILFVIPGLMLSTYLMFALHSRVAESATGMNALIRSTDLVRGYWWAVTGRVALVTIAMMVAFFGVGFMLGIVAVIVGLTEETIGSVSLLAIEPIFGSLGTLICLYAMTVVYKVLVTIKTGVEVPPNSVRAWYTGLAVLTPFLMAAIIALVAFGFVDQFEQMDSAMPEKQMPMKKMPTSV